jgi:PIN domain nuclease of toxin-antitoxin system
VTRLLVDSHILLWHLADDAQLRSELLAELERPSNDLYVSAATVWEVEIKLAAGRLDVDGDLWDAAASTGYAGLAVTADHAVVAARLPRHHADPFDRMLVAQARVEHLTLVTAEHALASYGVDLLLA